MQWCTHMHTLSNIPLYRYTKGEIKCTHIQVKCVCGSTPKFLSQTTVALISQLLYPQHPALAPKPHPPQTTPSSSQPLKLSLSPPTSSAPSSAPSSADVISSNPLPPSSLGPLQLARINQLHNMIFPHQGGGGAGGRGQVDLEGHAPTADVNLFKEARRVTQEMLVRTSVCVCVCVISILIVLLHGLIGYIYTLSGDFNAGRGRGRWKERVPTESSGVWLSRAERVVRLSLPTRLHLSAKDLPLSVLPQVLQELTHPTQTCRESLVGGRPCSLVVD